MTKTLVLGGSGLVGSQFKGDQYLKPTRKECDLRDMAQVEALFQNHVFDTVIMAAGTVGGIKANLERKGEFFYDNITQNVNVIECSRRHGIKNLVAFMSTCIFPQNIQLPLTESKIHVGIPHFSNDAYAYSKRMVDIQIRAYREQYGLNYKSVIPCNLYGLEDNYSLESGHIIPSVVHKIYLARENNTSLTLFGNGNGMREFLFAKDVVKLVELVLKDYHESEPIILTTAKEVSIAEVVRIITDIMKFKGDIVWDGRFEGQLRKPSSNAKIKKYWPNFKFTDLREGLVETISHFEANYDTIRK